MTTQVMEEIDGQAPTIKELVQQHVDAGVPQAQIARETDIGTATLNQYLKGSYKARTERLDRKLAKWLRSQAQRARTRLEAVEPPDFFEGHSAALIIEIFERAQSLGLIGLVSGVPGIGKTTSAEEYRARSANVWIATCSTYTKGVNTLLQMLAETLGVSAKGTSGKGYADAIVRRVERSQGLLIVDEAHNADVAALDALRSLHDRTKVGLVLMGSRDLAVRAARMPQLASRFSMRADIKSPNEDDIVSLLNAWMITDSKQRDFLWMIAKQPGHLRAASRVLEMAASAAKRSGKPMTIRQQQEAWAVLSPTTVTDGEES